MVEIHVEKTIHAPVDEVFDWLADPVSLAAAPLVLKAGWAKDSAGPGAGAVREVTGIGAWFREEITAYDRPQSYTYPIVPAFPALNHDRRTPTFTPSGNRKHRDWLNKYTHPV